MHLEDTLVWLIACLQCQYRQSYAMVDQPELILASTKMLKTLNKADIHQVALLSELSDFKDGESIFQTGDSSTQFFIVVKGEVAIRMGNNDQHADIARFLKGDSFGELDLFSGDSRSANAYAVGPVRLLEFPHRKTNLSVLGSQWPALNARLLHAFLIYISARIRNTNALVKANTPLIKELRNQVYVDKLTGLYNKTLFEETLYKSLASESPVGLIMFKPDNFKHINDSYGHEAGDAVLKHIANELRKFLPHSDMLFRYMGNENALIVSNPRRDTLKDLSERMGTFLREMDLSSILNKEVITLSVSMGLVLSPEHGKDSETLIDTAHSLTLEGRRRGGNHIFFPEDSDQL